MKDKKWYDDIPPGGVLCYAPNGMMTNIILVTKDSKAWNGDSNYFIVDELTPLTAAEWWDFAPWQDVKDAPQTGWFLVIENCTGKIQLAKRYLDDEFIDEFNQSIVFKKWLPLPPQVI